MWAPTGPSGNKIKIVHQPYGIIIVVASNEYFWTSFLRAAVNNEIIAVLAKHIWQVS